MMSFAQRVQTYRLCEETGEACYDRTCLFYSRCMTERAKATDECPTKSRTCDLANGRR